MIASNTTLTIIEIGPTDNAMCNSTAMCSGHGRCVDALCACVDFWTGAICSVSFHDALGQPWSVYIIGFIALFTIVAAVALAQLLRSALLGGAKVFNYWRLIHALVLVEGVDQMLDLGLAPGASPVAPTWVRHVLQGISVYLIVAIICVILLFWCQTYTRTFAAEAHPRIRNVERGYLALLVVFFIIEMTCRLVYSELDSPSVVFVLHTLFVAICCAVTAGGFLIWGRRAYAHIMNTSAIVFRKRLEQIHFLTVTASIVLILTVVSLVAFGIATFSDPHLMQNPEYYLIQQVVFRTLQAAYCLFILWALRVPPEIESRAVYVPIR